MKRIYIEADVLTVDGEEIKVWVDEEFKGANKKHHFIAMRTNIIRGGVPSDGGLLFPEVEELDVIPPAQIKVFTVAPCVVYEA